MRRPRLIVVCGIPGAGKSTFARRASDRWGAASFASETFAEQLGPAARAASGDLSKEAIAHAYAAMRDAAAEALSRSPLVLAVGSFRAEPQRKLFRDMALERGADATTVRVSCPVATAAERVRARRALGERGPGEDAIRRIDAELDQARGIDAVLTNEGTVEDYHRRIDRLIEALAAGDAALGAGMVAQAAQMKGN